MWSMWGAQDPLDAVTLDLQCVGHLAAGADAQEGIKSFFEKRPPVFPAEAVEGHAALRSVGPSERFCLMNGTFSRSCAT